jgi:hypothetical protein
MTPSSPPEPASEPPAEPWRRTWRETSGTQFKRLLTAIRNGDDAMVERSVLALSQRSRWLAPLALAAGAFALLFQGVKLLFTNWRLTLVQVLPAMWIWTAMLDLKLHVLHGKQFHILRGPLLVPVVLAIAAVTAAAYFLNAVFAFAVSGPSPPQIGPAFTQAVEHRRSVLAWGFTIGLALGFSTIVVQRWGRGWFALALGVVVAVMMLTYVLVPSRLLGAVPSDRSRRDRLSATAIGGVVGGLVCSPPYALGRLGVVLLGSHALRFLGIAVIAVAVLLQTGATSATKAIKMSAKLALGRDAPPVEVHGEADPEADVVDTGHPAERTVTDEAT